MKTCPCSNLIRFVPGSFSKGGIVLRCSLRSTAVAQEPSSKTTWSQILILTYWFRNTIVGRMKKKPEHRDLFAGALELMILKSLHWRPMHGYALAQRLQSISEDYLQIEEGSLYPALQRMLKAGWLETEMGLSARNRPVRIFRVTKAGRKHLEQELESVKKMFAGFNRVLQLAGRQEA